MQYRYVYAHTYLCNGYKRWWWSSKSVHYVYHCAKYDTEETKHLVHHNIYTHMDAWHILLYEWIYIRYNEFISWTYSANFHFPGKSSTSNTHRINMLIWAFVMDMRTLRIGLQAKADKTDARFDVCNMVMVATTKPKIETIKQWHTGRKTEEKEKER